VLNYLCVTAGRPLPAPKSFPWNWVEPSEADAFDGVCVMNRDQLVRHLVAQLGGYVEQNKWLPDPVIVEVYLATAEYDFGIGRRAADPETP